MPARRALAGAFLLVLAGSGCTADEAGTEPSSPASPSQAKGSSAASPAASPTRQSPPGGGAVTYVDDAFAAQGWFRSPSGNVRCWIRVAAVDCSVVERSWGAPTPPPECAATRGHASVGASPRGVALRTDCYPLVDTAAVNGVPADAVLPYGRAVQLGSVRCASEERGITCLLRPSGQGFTVSRAEVALSPERSALTDTEGRPVPSPADVRVPHGFSASFRTPSGAIRCEVFDERAGCGVSGATWQAPPPQGDCDADRATEVEVRRSGPGRAYTTCRSDAMPWGAVLAYGRSLTVGALTCSSVRSGLTCRSAATRHGFTVSRSAFRGF